MGKKSTVSFGAKGVTPSGCYLRGTDVIRLGYVPLSDCAPLVMAHELGLFRELGLVIELSRELGWASIREKVVYGELDGSHAIAGLPLAVTLGLDSVQCDCVASLILNRHGNAITLSTALVKSRPANHKEIFETIRSRAKAKPVILAAVSKYSTHYFLLRQWLKSGGVDLGREVRFVVLPPGQMTVNLAQGNIDGFCVGEPWNSEAVSKRAGVCVALSVDLAPGHPEKVFMVRSDFARERLEILQHITLALLEACRFCSIRENHTEIARVLSHRQYVGLPASILLRSLNGSMELSQGHWITREDFDLFFGDEVNAPNPESGKRVYQWLKEAFDTRKVFPPAEELVPRVFRNDIYASIRGRLRAVDFRQEEAAAIVCE